MRGSAAQSAHDIHVDNSDSQLGGAGHNVNDIHITYEYHIHIMNIILE